MKTAYYVATIINAYKRAFEILKDCKQKNIPYVCPKVLIEELEKCKKNAKNQILLLKYLLENQGVHFLSDLNKTFSQSATKKLLEKGIIEVFEEKIERTGKKKTWEAGNS